MALIGSACSIGNGGVLFLGWFVRLGSCGGSCWFGGCFGGVGWCSWLGVGCGWLSWWLCLWGVGY